MGESRALAQDGGDVSVSPQRGELQREQPNKGSARTRGGMEESSGMGPGVQACPVPLPYSDIYSSPSQSPAAKPEKEQLSPAFSAEDCKHSGRTSTGGGVNSSPSEEPRLPKRRPPSSGRQFPCSSYGCRLAFPSPRELAQHLHSHLQPTQSMEGKLFHCSTPSCTETFPSMQELMAHTKLHYKPNRYFKCENCLLRFRTHRSLFKHLHVCSDQSHSPAPPPGPLPPALEKELPDAQRPAGPSPDKAPLLTPLTLTPQPRPRAPFPLLEASLYSSAALPSYSSQASGPVPAAFLPYLGPSPYGLAPSSGPQRLRPFLPAQSLPSSGPGSGPGSSSNTNAAVWKKNQGSSGSPRRPPGSSEGPTGHSSTSRIVWEHTRGRYTCMQCPFSTASRPAMTLHLEDHRKTPPPQPPSPSTPPQLEAQGGPVWSLEPTPGSSSGPPSLTQGPPASGEDWDF